ncbi:SIR2 family NAD-dependent protein deacylase [Syntrophomonas erecta]
MDQNISKLAGLIKNSPRTVVVTGAGISTEAGIPDFRGQNGIYRKLGEDRVMRIINIDFFRRQPEEFYKFYRQYFHFPPVEPSKAHVVLADMEKNGHIYGVVTQNIDNLHQKAGSKKVIPIHGNAERYVCPARHCQAEYETSYVDNYPEVVPRCSQCNTILKPDVVLFGEQIYSYIDAREMILSARLVIVIGSSLTVYPLAGFVREFSTFTQDLVIINKGPTYMDHAAQIKFDTNHTGDLLEKVNRLL